MTEQNRLLSWRQPCTFLWYATRMWNVNSRYMCGI